MCILLFQLNKQDSTSINTTFVMVCQLLIVTNCNFQDIGCTYDKVKYFSNLMLYGYELTGFISVNIIGNIGYDEL